MTRKKLKKLWKWEIRVSDPYEPRFYTRYLFFIPAPSIEFPYPAVLVMVAGAQDRVISRFASLRRLLEVYQLPEVQQGLCEEALKNANEIADEFTETIRAVLHKRELPKAIEQISPEACVVHDKAGGF